MLTQKQMTARKKGSGHKSAICTFNLKRIELFLVALMGPEDCGLRSEMWKARKPCRAKTTNAQRKRGKMSNNEDLLAAVLLSGNVDV